MTESVASAPINIFPASGAIPTPERLDEIIRLQESGIVIGMLSNIIEPEDQDTLLAMIAGELIELPRAHLSKLTGYLGKRVVVNLCLGEYRVELSTQ